MGFVIGFGLGALAYVFLRYGLFAFYTVDQNARGRALLSEEGTPMGIGVWYEMRVGDASDFLSKNADPRGSLAANVANATVRCLSNMPLEKLLAGRHEMSRVGIRRRPRRDRGEEKGVILTV